MWTEAGLNWSDFVKDEDVNKFVTDQVCSRM